MHYLILGLSLWLGIGFIIVSMTNARYFSEGIPLFVLRCLWWPSEAVRLKRVFDPEAQLKSPEFQAWEADYLTAMRQADELIERRVIVGRF